MTEYIRYNKWLLTGMGCLILFVYILLNYIVPEFNYTLQVYQNWQKQEEKIASVSDWKSQLNRLNARQEKLEAFFSEIYVSLPDDDQMSAIVNQVFNEAEATGIWLNQMRPAKRVEFESHIEIPITVTLKGTYHETGQFVNAIEQSGYLMKVDEIEILSEEMDAPLMSRLLIKVIILKKNTKEHLNIDA